MNIYYVYAYLRENNTPYYIGKGRDYRAYDHHNSVHVPKDNSRIEFIAKNLSEQEAFVLEKDLIQLYGRKDLGTGILRNLTDGGEGSSGRKFTEESKKKISESCRGKKKLPFSETHKQNLSKSYKGHSNFKGRHHSEETKNRMRDTLRATLLRKRSNLSASI
jgi:hypothetical protein